MATPVEGPENPGSAAVRPPVREAQTYRATKPTYADGNVVELQAGLRGAATVQLMAPDTGSPVTSAGNGDGTGGTGLIIVAQQFGFNGASFDRLRTPIVFKHFASTAIVAGTGATIWTPTAGKKFRLMGWLISSSAAGQLLFGDNLAATVIARSEAVPAAGVSNEDAIGNGILSAAANNVLKLDGPTGNVAGMVWGTEE